MDTIERQVGAMVLPQQTVISMLLKMILLVHSVHYSRPYRPHALNDKMGPLFIYSLNFFEKQYNGSLSDLDC